MPAIIYETMRAARECPNLFLFNVGAWTILGMLSSDAAAIVAIERQPRHWTIADCGEQPLLPPPPVPPPVPRPPTPLEMWRDAAFGMPGLALQGGVVFGGCCLMLFSVGRGFQFRRMSRRRLRRLNPSSPVTP
jgi:hypothetical protein